MDMDHDRRRNDRVHAGLDRRPQAVGVQLPIHEVGRRRGARISVDDRFAQRIQTHGREDILRKRVSEPGSRRLDPHDAVLLDRRVAAGALRPQRIGAERSRQLSQCTKFTVIDIGRGHHTACGVNS
jgi:hypothetical protein